MHMCTHALQDLRVCLNDDAERVCAMCLWPSEHPTPSWFAQVNPFTSIACIFIVTSLRHASLCFRALPYAARHSTWVSRLEFVKCA